MPKPGPKSLPPNLKKKSVTVFLKGEDITRLQEELQKGSKSRFFTERTPFMTLSNVVQGVLQQSWSQPVIQLSQEEQTLLMEHIQGKSNERVSKGSSPWNTLQDYLLTVIDTQRSKSSTKT